MIRQVYNNSDRGLSLCPTKSQQLRIACIQKLNGSPRRAIGQRRIMCLQFQQPLVKIRIVMLAPDNGILFKKSDFFVQPAFLP